MNTHFSKCRSVPLAIVIGLAWVAAPAMAQNVEVFLDGSQAVPPVYTRAAGTAWITVSYEKEVGGTMVTSGVEGTSAYIYEGAPGVSGQAIIPFVHTAENEWKVADGAILSDDQLESFKAGNLYVNVHSAVNPTGEIRGQLQP